MNSSGLSWTWALSWSRNGEPSWCSERCLCSIGSERTWARKGLKSAGKDHVYLGYFSLFDNCFWFFQEIGFHSASPKFEDKLQLAKVILFLNRSDICLDFLFLKYRFWRRVARCPETLEAQIQREWQRQGNFPEYLIFKDFASISSIYPNMNVVLGYYKLSRRVFLRKKKYLTASSWRYKGYLACNP